MKNPGDGPAAAEAFAERPGGTSDPAGALPERPGGTSDPAGAFPESPGGTSDPAGAFPESPGGTSAPTGTFPERLAGAPEGESEPARILIVDDEQVARDSLAAWFREDGHAVDVAPSAEEALAACRRRPYAVCFLDLRMPGGMDGLEALPRIRELLPEVSVIIMTAYASVDSAVEAIKHGAEDYLVKPFNLKEASLLVERVLRNRRMRVEIAYLRNHLRGRYRFQDLISKNPRMHEIFQMVQQVCGLRSTVLIEGESGVGKELVARAIHFSGERAEHPFIAVSCTAINEPLLESELFGHERGAFTGAVSRKPGKFELAAGGSVFLDEMGSIPLKVQLELLRVLEQRSFYRVGGVEEVKVDARVIAATNRDLRAAVTAGTFREDLYYRLNVIRLQIPPLRERMEDVPLLASHFCEQIALEHGRPAPVVSSSALAVLLAHDWPGNVRELRNAIERAMATSRADVLEPGDFDFLRHARPLSSTWSPPTHMAMHEIERDVIEAVLKRVSGNVREAARILQLDRSTLYDKIRRYGIQR